MLRALTLSLLAPLLLAPGARARDVLMKGAASDACARLTAAQGRCLLTHGRFAYVRTNLTLAAFREASASVEAADDVVRDTTTGILEPVVKVFAVPSADVAFTYSHARRMRSRHLAFVQRDAPYHLAFLNSAQSGFRDSEYVYSHTGADTRVYVVGGALQADHVDFTGRGRSVSDDRFVFAGYESQGPCSEWQSTHAASVAAGDLYGVAKDAEIVSVVVEPGCREPSSGRALAEGLQWVLRHASSVGAKKAVALVLAKVRAEDALAAELVDSLAAALLERDVAVVAAAGWKRADACRFSPGRVPGVVTVASAQVVQVPGRIVAVPSDETNYGRCVDVWAQGSWVEGASAGGVDATAVMSGTPQAAAMVAGALALLREQHPEYNAAAVVKRMLDATRNSTMFDRPDTTTALLQTTVVD